MKLKICCTFVSILLLGNSISFGNNKEVIEFNDPAKSIIVKKSQPTFEITVQSNPTTGYSWFLKQYDDKIVEPIKQKFYPPRDKKIVGAAGYEKWLFRVRAAGFLVPETTNIKLVYSRPWENQEGQTNNYKVVTYNDN